MEKILKNLAWIPAQGRDDVVGSEINEAMVIFERSQRLAAGTLNHQTEIGRKPSS